MRKVREAKERDRPTANRPSDARIADQVRDLKNLLQDLGRLAPLRDPVAKVSHELTPPQLHSVLWLGADGSLSANVLATRVGCGAPTITGVIDRLEKLGYAERERDDVDRRVVRVKLTAKGRAIYDELDGRIT